MTREELVANATEAWRKWRCSGTDYRDGGQLMADWHLSLQPEAPATRRVVQVATCAAHTVALCNDDTLLMHSAAAPQWSEFPPIPQPEP